MKRREFLKIAGVAPLLPLAAQHNGELDLDKLAAPLVMFTNEIEFVIAETPEEATQIILDTCMPKGMQWYGTQEQWDKQIAFLKDSYKSDSWEILDPDLEFTFRHADGSDEMKTIREFIEQHGKGYFANTEY